jgi:hypothetical protein
MPIDIHASVASVNHAKSFGDVWLDSMAAVASYLRVKVDGGTLYQNGKPLPWSEHGYYEVGLDAGSLTLSPDMALPAH